MQKIDIDKIKGLLEANESVRITISPRFPCFTIETHAVAVDLEDNPIRIVSKTECINPCEPNFNDLIEQKIRQDLHCIRQQVQKEKETQPAIKVTRVN